MLGHDVVDEKSGSSELLSQSQSKSPAVYEHKQWLLQGIKEDVSKAGHRTKGRTKYVAVSLPLTEIPRSLNR